jgi:hypothetical protein
MNGNRVIKAGFQRYFIKILSDVFYKMVDSPENRLEHIALQSPKVRMAFQSYLPADGGQVHLQKYHERSCGYFLKLATISATN